MAQSRREQLEAAVNGGTEAPGAVGQAEEYGDLGKLVLEAVPNIPDSAEDDPVETRVRKPRSERKAPPRRSTKDERQVEDVAEKLQSQFDLMFTALTAIKPVTGTYALANSEKAVNALLDIAKKRPKFMAVLSKFADGFNGLDVATYVIGILIALQVDAGTLDAQSVPARLTGVTQIVDEYFSDEPETTEMPGPMDVGFFSPVA